MNHVTLLQPCTDVFPKFFLNLSSRENERAFTFMLSFVGLFKKVIDFSRVFDLFDLLSEGDRKVFSNGGSEVNTQKARAGRETKKGGVVFTSGEASRYLPSGVLAAFTEIRPPVSPISVDD